jgi:colanic acid biosynthesis protein WcaH
MATRVHAVAKNELGATIEFSKDPLAVNEIMSTSRDVRGHFISLLYECKLTSPLDPDHEYKSGVVRNGEWAWHATCPDNLIPAHKVYKRYIGQAD